MKIVAVATTLVLTVGGALVEAAALPKPSSLLGASSKTLQFHHYVSKPTTYTSPEWGLRTASLRSLPIQIHPYVTGRARF